MSRINLDMDVLRTLVEAQLLGGFNRAADRLGRSQSAISQQIRKLEEQAGAPLFRKQGRGLALTEAGEILHGYARRILALNDEALAALQGWSVEGQVRLGLPSDLAETWLPACLGSFKRGHPAVRIEASTDRNGKLLDRLDRGELDLVLAFGRPERPDAQLIADLPMVWIGPASPSPLETPLSLALFQSPCFFRHTGLEALDRAGMAWRVAFTSHSLHGLWAAVVAGLGITLRTEVGLPAGLRVLDGLPSLPSLALCLHDGGRAPSPATARLRAIVAETAVEQLAGRS